MCRGYSVTDIGPSVIPFPGHVILKPVRYGTKATVLLIGLIAAFDILRIASALPSCNVIPPSHWRRGATAVFVRH